MFTAFIRPARPELLTVFLLLALILGVGRFIAGDGQDWNTLASSGSALIFAMTATRLPAVRGLDVALRTWFAGLLGTALGWSALLAVIGTTAATVMQLRSPYYMWYDSFLVTSGSVNWTDTAGQPHVLESAGISAGTVFLTFLVYLVAFLLSTLLGALVGLIRVRFNIAIAVIAVAVIAALIFAFVVWLADGTAPDHHLQLLGAGIPAVVLTALLAWLTARKIEP